jgi:hypothetical protein
MGTEEVSSELKAENTVDEVTGESYPTAPSLPPTIPWGKFVFGIAASVTGVFATFIGFFVPPLLLIGLPLLFVGISASRKAGKPLREYGDPAKRWATYHEVVAEYSNSRGGRVDIAGFLERMRSGLEDKSVCFPPNLPAAEIGKGVRFRQEPYEDGECMLAWRHHGRWRKQNALSVLLTDRNVLLLPNIGGFGKWRLDQLSHVLPYSGLTSSSLCVFRRS